MRRSFLAAVALAGAVAAAGAAPGGGGAEARLSFATYVLYGGGTGTIRSPSALCESSENGSRQTRLSDEIGLLESPAWRGDGRMLAYSVYDAVARTNTVRVTPADRWRPVTVASSGRGPAWSPDGRTIAFSGRDGVYVVPAAGGSPTRVGFATAEAATWSPDGRIAYGRLDGSRRTGVRILAPDGSERALTDDGGLPAWSPDGRWIAFVASGSHSPGFPFTREEEVFAVSPDGTARRPVTRSVRRVPGVDTSFSRPAWSPDGNTLAAVRTSTINFGKGESPIAWHLFVVDFDDGGQTITRLPEPTADPAWRSAPPPTAAEAARRPCILRGAGTIRGRGYDDLIVGSGRADRIAGGAGDDWIHAAGGRDVVTGGSGRDEIWSGYGPDTLAMRDHARDVVHCGEAGSDLGRADRIDALLGSCRRVARG